MVDPAHSFHIADYIVFGVTLVISIGIGIYYALAGDRQRTTQEYLVGGRTMKFLPVAISLIVSFESSIMMLGYPAEMYVYGVQWWLSCVGFLISQLLSTVIIVPLVHPLKITSTFEYLELRYNSTAVRLLGSFFGILTYTWYMGIVLFGPAIALEAVTGFPQWGSIFLIGFVAIIYTSIGGLKAVIWTDVFQAFVMFAGMFAVLIKGTLDVGGPTKVWNLASEGGRLNLFNFDPDPRTRHTFWNLMMGAIIRGFGFAFNQSTIQRISSTKTEREAKLVLLVTAPCFFLSLTMACYEGIVAFAYYQTVGCDPLRDKKITNPNQIIPFTVMDIFKALPGMPGLFLASLFSASLSTLSSGLSSLSALVWVDFVKPRIGEMSEFKATLIAKFTVLVFGLFGCGVALLVSLIGGTLIQIATSLMAASAGPFVGLFLMGCFCPCANAKGAFIGGFFSLIFTSWLSLGHSFSKSVKKTPWLPLATTDKCPANQNASFFSTTAPSLAMLNLSHQDDLGSTYGYPLAEGDSYYSTVTSSFMESTTAAVVPEVVAQGMEVMYTLSYQWLPTVGVSVTLIIGTIISVLTGENKEGDVHPRYLISFCDHLCCCLPEAVRKLFRCGKEHISVKEDILPIQDLDLHKEVVSDDPITKAFIEENTSVTLVMELIVPLESDVNLGSTNQNEAAEQPQNRGASANHLATTSGGGDDDDGDVSKDNYERMTGKEGEKGKEEKEEKEVGEEQEKEEEDDEENAESSEMQPLQADNADRV